MKVQTKILLLLVLVGALFVGGLAALRTHERAAFRRIVQENALRKEKFFNDFLQRRSAQLEMLAKDDTYSDDMVNAIGSADPAAIRKYVNDGALTSYNADAIWVYHPDQSWCASINRLDADDELRFIPLPSGAFNALGSQRLMHFYLPTKQGLMEVSAATVHRSNDSQRRGPLQGYFFTGRLWSKESVGDMSRDTDDTIYLQPPHAANAPNEDDANDGIITFARMLAGWDDRPVARLLVRNDSEIIRELNKSSNQLLWLLVGFAVVAIALLAVSLMRWVSRPLHLISTTLETEKLGPLDKLRNDQSEFGGVSRMIREFFGQREKLIAEINERKTAQEALRQSGEQLRQAQKMEAVGRLAGGVAHDFNNLLTAILGYAELLIVRKDLDPGARLHVETIQKAGRQAAAVTHQLLAFSRKQVLQPRVLDLGELVHDFEKILRRVIGEHIELVTDTRDGGGRVKADPNQLEQVILNLGVNARDAMSKGGKLTIRTGNARLDEAAAKLLAPDLEAGRYVTLEVSDTGHGMDEETKTRIFEPFFTTKGPGKGTGLGLSTVYGVVKQSGGTISVESAPGKGCTFRVLLPQEMRDVDEGRPKTAAFTHTPAPRVETVLIVEDEEIVRQLVCTVLSDRGYNVLCASNGEEALEMSGEHEGKIALLITDVVMPQMGGLELSRIISERRPDTRVLYVSGYSESDMNEQGILAPDADFMEKPFTPQALTRKVREVLNPMALPIAREDGNGLDGHAKDGAAFTARP